MKSRQFRRALLSMVVAAPITLLGTTETATASQPTTVTYALWDPVQIIGYRKVAALFEKENPNIKINIELVPSSSYWTKLFTGLATGTAPDVFWVNNLNFLQLVSQHHIISQANLITRSHINLSAYVDPNFFKYDNQIWMLPKDWDTEAIVYNKTLATKLGVTMPSSLSWNPTNGGTFLKLAQRLTVDKNGKHPGQAGFTPSQIVDYGVISENDSHEEAQNFIAENGGRFVTTQFGKSFGLTAAADQQAYQFLVNLILKYHVSPPASETNPPITNPGQELFLKGHVAMYLAGDWHLSSLVHADFKWGVVPYPAGPDGRITVINSLGNGINAALKNKPALLNDAWKWVEFVTGPQAAQIMGSGGYIWPSLRKYDTGFINYYRTKLGVNVTPFLAQAKGKTILNPVTYNYNEIETAQNNIFSEMYLGQLPVQKALAQAEKVGNSDASAGSAS